MIFTKIFTKINVQTRFVTTYTTVYSWKEKLLESSLGFTGVWRNKHSRSAAQSAIVGRAERFHETSWT